MRGQVEDAKKRELLAADDITVKPKPKEKIETSVNISSKIQQIEKSKGTNQETNESRKKVRYND